MVSQKRYQTHLIMRSFSKRLFVAFYGLYLERVSQEKLKGSKSATQPDKSSQPMISKPLKLSEHGFPIVGIWYFA